MKYLIPSPYSFPLSSEQKAAAVCAWFGDSVAIKAGAGSGKSHTARAVVKNYNGTVHSIPFGRALADEEIEVYTGFENVTSLNFHRRGIRLLSNVEVDEGKLKKLAESMEGLKDEELTGTVDLCKMLKTEAFGVLDNALTGEAIADKYGFKPEFVPNAVALLKLSDKQTKIADFNDMLRFPILQGKTNFLNGLIVLDEVQDYTPLAFAFLTRCLVKNTNQVFMIGDPERQCLQAFAGASPELFDIMSSFFGCQAFELTVNRRCSKAVVANAPFKGAMVALEDAPQGEVGSKDMKAVMDEISAGEYATDAIISEANAPLVIFGISLLSKNVPVQMRTARLEKLIYKYCPFKFLDTRYVKIGEVANKVRVLIQERQEEGVDSSEAQDVANAIESLESYCLAKGMVKPSWVRSSRGKMLPKHPIMQALDILCSSKAGITLLTGHTAKGLEWNTVFHLPGKIKSPEKDWQEHQMNCLSHVIATRARLNHYSLIPSDDASVPA